ncbi:hypothetical protein R5W24_003032 [Gemmata sp. JC717]|uniref:hypothetical protein n=1 Tax=Gemmata algarum TaxID=2975278 RepID=UPI0021BBB2D2|nr:hypothetical protein [Gemmata algarum]MDY3553918.1 hypothetical protein [Gemmata algarum]
MRTALLVLVCVVGVADLSGCGGSDPTPAAGVNAPPVQDSGAGAKKGGRLPAPKK